jgi:acyl-coenzyme A synthetase/AMP-(fatty) acid ligase
MVRESDELNYANFVDRLAGLWGARTAFVLDRPISYPGFAGDVLSYRDVARIVSKMAFALRELGVRRGDRVGLVAMNRVEMAFVNFAAAKLGAIPVPMNFMLRPNEIEYIVQKAGIELLVCDSAILGNVVKDTSAIPSVKRWAIVGAEAPSPGIVSIAALMEGAPDHLDPVEPASLDDTAMLFFTSGTTGFPKGAELSHYAVLIGLRTHAKWSARFAPRVSKLQRLAMLVMPVAAAAGYQQMILYLGMGTPAYFMSRFDVGAIFDTVEEMKPSLFTGAPAMFRMLLAAGAAQRDWSSIRVFGGGSDAFDEELIRNVRNLGARKTLLRTKRPGFISGYGMAEASSYVTQTPPFPAGDNCCGWVLPGVKYRIVDEDGREVKRGQQGELHIKGRNMLKGYWNDPEATAEAFTKDGWYRTHDVVRQGKWKMLYFVGRSADIIKSGGYKISANEVDQHLTQHPDVEHASTVGIPHPIKGERPFAAVKLRPGAHTPPEDILAWARERIAPYKCPRAIVVMNDMPFTMSMKPKRREVRDRLIAELPENVKAGTE